MSTRNIEIDGVWCIFGLHEGWLVGRRFGGRRLP